MKNPVKNPASADLPGTSLTICSRNRHQLLLETVESVLESQEVPQEIVIVDQSDLPHPELQEMGAVRGCEIRYLQIPSNGVGRARNQAIEAASHDILVLTDDDMLVAPTWFGTLVRSLVDKGERAVVTGRVLAAEEEGVTGFAPSTKSDEEPRVYEGRVGKDILYTGNMIMLRSAVDEVGVFDERLGAGAHFPAAYDNDFGYRLLEAGYRVFYEPEAVLYHRAWRASGAYFRLRWNYGRGQGAFHAKHLSLRDPYMLRRLLWNVARHLVRFPYRILIRSKRAVGDLVFVFGLFSGAGEWLLTQRR